MGVFCFVCKIQSVMGVPGGADYGGGGGWAGAGGGQGAGGRRRAGCHALPVCGPPPAIAASLCIPLYRSQNRLFKKHRVGYPAC